MMLLVAAYSSETSTYANSLELQSMSSSAILLRSIITSCEEKRSSATKSREETPSTELDRRPSNPSSLDTYSLSSLTEVPARAARPIGETFSLAYACVSLSVSLCSAWI